MALSQVLLVQTGLSNYIIAYVLRKLYYQPRRQPMHIQANKLHASQRSRQIRQINIFEVLSRNCQMKYITTNNKGFCIFMWVQFLPAHCSSTAPTYTEHPTAKELRLGLNMQCQRPKTHVDSRLRPQRHYSKAHRGLQPILQRQRYRATAGAL